MMEMVGVIAAIAIITVVMGTWLHVAGIEARTQALADELDYVRTVARMVDAFARENCEDDPLVLARIRDGLAEIIGEDS